jgi:hypothetical protein
MARINFNNPFRKKSKIKDDYLYDANPDGVKTPDLNRYANSYASQPGSRSVDGNAIMGQLGKFYEEYGPSMQLMQNNPGTRGLVEAGLDYGVRGIPGVGQVYGAVQDFNRVTGGINVGKAFGIKQDPFKALGNRIFGDPNKNQMTPAQMAILGRNATRMSGLENAANADIASARMERDKLGGEQRNVMDLLTDMAMNPQSSRDLAATTGAGLAPLQELINKRAADSQANISRRGLSGGMATGILEGTRQSGDAAISDLINKTTLEAMSRRPQMVNALAGVIGQEQSRLDARDTAARGMIGQIDQQEFARQMERERMGLQRDQLAAAERSSNLQGLGALAGQFGPDLMAELKRIRERPSKRTATQPLVTQSPGLDTGTVNETVDPNNFTYRFDAPEETPLAEGMGLEGQQSLPYIAPFATESPSSTERPMAELPVESATETVLRARYPNYEVGQVTPPDRRGIRFKLTKNGWRKLQTAPSRNFGPFSTNYGLGG